MPDRFIEIRFDPETARRLNDPEFLARQGRQREVITQAVVAFFGRKAANVAAHVVRNYLSGQRLRRRTGSLARSVTGVSGLFRGARTGIAPALRVGIFRGPAAAYAAVQEYGTRGKNPDSPFPTIFPRKAKALAMPVGDALTPAGVPRYESPRDYPGDLRFVPFRRGISQGGFTSNSDRTAIGGLYEARSLKRPENVDPEDFSLRDAKLAFLLLSRVDLRPKWYLRDAFTEVLPSIVDDLARFLGEFLLIGGNRPTVSASIGGR